MASVGKELPEDHSVRVVRPGPSIGGWVRYHQQRINTFEPGVFDFRFFIPVLFDIRSLYIHIYIHTTTNRNTRESSCRTALLPHAQPSPPSTPFSTTPGIPASRRKKKNLPFFLLGLWVSYSTKYNTKHNSGRASGSMLLFRSKKKQQPTTPPPTNTQSVEMNHFQTHFKLIHTPNRKQTKCESFRGVALTKPKTKKKHPPQRSSQAGSTLLLPLPITRKQNYNFLIQFFFQSSIYSFLLFFFK